MAIYLSSEGQQSHRVFCSRLLLLLFVLGVSSTSFANKVLPSWPSDHALTIYVPNLAFLGGAHPSSKHFPEKVRDYVAELRRLTSWPIELRIGEFHSTFAAFENDPHGIMLFLASTPERTQKYYFYPAFNNPYVYKVRQGELPVSNLSEVAGKSIGVFGFGSAPHAFIESKLPVEQIHVFDALTLLEGALITHLVDVILTNVDHFGFHQQAWSKQAMIPRLATDVPGYMNVGHFAVHKSMPAMVALLNELMPWQDSLLAFQELKAFSELGQLTPVVEQLMTRNAPINACISSEGFPFQWVDHDGVAGGSYPSLLRAILRPFNLPINFTQVSSISDQMAAVTEGLCDLTWHIDLPLRIGKGTNTAPVYKGKYLLIGHKDRLLSLEGDRHKTTWAVNSMILPLVKEVVMDDDVTLLSVKPLQQLSMLVEGGADFAILDSQFWRNNVYELSQKGFVVIDDFNMEASLTFHTQDPDLLELLNIGIQQLPGDYAVELFTKAAYQEIVRVDHVVVPWIQIVILVMVLVGIILTLLFFLRLSQRADYVHTQALDHTKRFLANMSHELRTPMNSILGMSELLSHDHKLDALQSEQANIIHRSGQHMLRLLNDVLDMSKIEAGEISLESIPVDIRRVVEDVAIQWRSRIEGKGLRFDCPRTLSLSAPFRMTDPTRLLQVLSNLVSNAVKFTSTGFIAVDVIQKANGDVLLRVEDTGIGIAKEHQSDVFKRFKQADDSINRRYGGTGLGLSISRSLVELMGGDLSFTSTLNKGTCFEMTLPLPMAEVVSDMSEHEVAATLLEDTLSQPAKVVSMTEAGQSVIRLLLVDDVATNNLVLSIMLKRLLGDVSIDEACSVAEAESLLQQNKYHAVFTDINMPEKTGIDLLTSIKKQRLQGVNPKLPVVACTGEEATLDLDMMFNDSMVKPVAIEPLKQVLISLGLFRKKLPAAPSADMSSDKSNDPLDIEVSTSFLTNLARLSNANDWAETVVNPCLAYLDLLIDDMRKHLARGELSDVQHIAFHFNTIGSLLGDEEFKVIARRLMEAKPLQTQLALECFIEFGRRVKYHQKKKAVA